MAEAYEGVVALTSGETLNQALVDAGMAKKYRSLCFEEAYK